MVIACVLLQVELRGKALVTYVTCKLESIAVIIAVTDQSLAAGRLGHADLHVYRLLP